MKDQFNVPELIDPLPRDAIAVPRKVIDDMLAVALTAQEMDTHGALRSASSVVIRVLQDLLKENDIGEVMEFDGVGIA